MWSILIENLPLTILLILATIVCGADVIKGIKEWQKLRRERREQIRNEVLEENQEVEAYKQILKEISEMRKDIADQKKHLEDIDGKLQDLTSSDMHDIKGWIVEQYMKFYVGLGYIDSFTADTIEHRYQDYKKEGGNSYIDTLMERLHTLPIRSVLQDRE